MMDKKALLLKKLMEKKDKVNPERELKLKALDELVDFMGGQELNELTSKSKAAVTVAADDPKKLPEALDKAKEIVKNVPLTNDYENMLEKKEEKSLSNLFEDKEEKEEDDLDLDSMSADELKQLLKEMLK